MIYYSRVKVNEAKPKVELYKRKEWHELLSWVCSNLKTMVSCVINLSTKECNLSIKKRYPTPKKEKCCANRYAKNITSMFLAIIFAVMVYDPTLYKDFMCICSLSGVSSN